jgi:uncharacterized protein YndB with AHSA1/START domain
VPPFASEQFRAITSANPECAWHALTATGIPLDYLHGMTIDTDWQPGARVTLALTDHWRLTGEVLAAERPRRLSYTLDDPPGSPSVYITWELHPPTMGRSSASTLTSPGRSPVAAKTWKAPGSPCSPAWSSTSNGARLRPRKGQGETSRRTAAAATPSRCRMP